MLEYNNILLAHKNTVNNFPENTLNSANKTIKVLNRSSVKCLLPDLFTGAIQLFILLLLCYFLERFPCLKGFKFTFLTSVF